MVGLTFPTIREITGLNLNQPSVGQFYSINVDNSEPYNVYGGLQDNGVWMASNTFS